MEIAHVNVFPCSVRRNVDAMMTSALTCNQLVKKLIPKMDWIIVIQKICEFTFTFSWTLNTAFQLNSLNLSCLL